MGINRRIELLALLLVDSGYAENLQKFSEVLVDGRRRPVKLKKTTKALAEGLVSHVTKTRKALAEAEKYLLACFKPAKAIRLPKKRRISRKDAGEEKAGDRGC